ncbi:M20/M25/M40 family metallo-hydrolase [Proteiniborus sp. MB09-C3]|uniref:M20/M25/M40 family metallo-hydrolase n=1 Tax=Proteiniborus sp. MB09-C3 TaxID=3050072 RepID=UPI00255554D6|nr:M20/M25/M40 family metallo-hydrolase [Proteiniborus sp. MB09-C3]WIV12951.1 M20/M25/M40 family metallo-hydrolase [Proteiniborus sp. MB09-C3]
MNKERLLNNFMEMLKIHSPSRKEGKYAEYLINLLKEMGASIYLDEGYLQYGGDSPSIIAKFPGDIEGEGVTLAAHMDVIEPNLNVQPVVEGNIIKTDGSTTLGGDDKGGVASIIEALRTIKEEKISHKDIYVVLTPCEEVGMLGAKYFNWDKVPEGMRPSKNMIVVDNAGAAGLIAHSAPSKYDIEVVFQGKKAHAGIEPEKGINAIAVASNALSRMNIGRIDDLTTSNISSISSQFPSNVVPDICKVAGEIRSHSEEKILDIIEYYKKACDEAVEKLGGTYKFDYQRDYPVLKPKDDLKFAKEFAKIYEELNIPSELKVIGGGSDSNIFAEQGFNSIIIGVGMNNVHTVEEYLVIDDLFKTTEAIIRYIKRNEK